MYLQFLSRDESTIRSDLFAPCKSPILPGEGGRLTVALLGACPGLDVYKLDVPPHFTSHSHPSFCHIVCRRWYTPVGHRHHLYTLTPLSLCAVLLIASVYLPIYLQTGIRAYQ